MVPGLAADEGHFDLGRGDRGFGADFRIAVGPPAPKSGHQAVKRLVIRMFRPHGADQVESL